MLRGVGLLQLRANLVGKTHLPKACANPTFGGLLITRCTCARAMSAFRARNGPIQAIPDGPPTGTTNVPVHRRTIVSQGCIPDRSTITRTAAPAAKVRRGAQAEGTSGRIHQVGIAGDAKRGGQEYGLSEADYGASFERYREIFRSATADEVTENKRNIESMFSEILDRIKCSRYVLSHIWRRPSCISFQNVDTAEGNGDHDLAWLRANRIADAVEMTAERSRSRSWV
jgi:hypothetical protein